MNRGMTLIEVLVALALLAVIMSAAMSWTATASQSLDAVAEPMAWELAADAALARMVADVRVGDLDESSAQKQPKVVLEDGKLQIESRSHGRVARTVIREYTFAAELGELTVKEGSRAALATSPARVLLGRVQAWHCDVDATMLSLEVISIAGQKCGRRVRLAAKPDEESPAAKPPEAGPHG